MTNTTTSTNTTNESRFFDLTNISEGYVNRIRLVKPAKGKPFYACTLRSGDLSVDVIAVSTKAVKALELIKPHFDKNAVIKAKWIASDLSISDFTYDKDVGEHQKGDKGFMAKGRLLDLVNVSVNGSAFEELPVNDTRKLGTFGFGYINDIKSFRTNAMSCSIAALHGEYNKDLGIKAETTRISCDIDTTLVSNMQHLQKISSKETAVIARFEVSNLKKFDFTYTKDVGVNKAGDKGAKFIGALTAISAVFLDGVRTPLLTETLASSEADDNEQNTNQVEENETQLAQAE